MATDAEKHDSSAIDPEALRRVEDVIEQLRWTYIREWAPAALEELEAAVQALHHSRTGQSHTGNGGGADQGSMTRHWTTVLRLTHDMKGQAGTFGLELLQDFAASLHALVEAEELAEARRIDLCAAHASAMRQVLTDVSGRPDGALDDLLERELRAGLRELTRLRFN
jgi:HPt (histidine-containing phosphotransfer) domain-containing protein